MTVAEAAESANSVMRPQLNLEAEPLFVFQICFFRQGDIWKAIFSLSSKNSLLLLAPEKTKEAMALVHRELILRQYA